MREKVILNIFTPPLIFVIPWVVALSFHTNVHVSFIFISSFICLALSILQCNYYLDLSQKKYPWLEIIKLVTSMASFAVASVFLLALLSVSVIDWSNWHT
jgi:hypothetical protein